MNEEKTPKCNLYSKIKTWEDLSADQHRACILRAEGLTLKEIAHILKLDYGTVRNWSSQFINRLLGDDRADYRVVSWKMITSQMISEVRTLMRRAIKNQDDAIFLKAVSEMNKLLQPYTPDDKQNKDIIAFINQVVPTQVEGNAVVYNAADIFRQIKGESNDENETNNKGLDGEPE